MRFELSEQSYLLSFDSKEDRWYLVTPGDGGLKAIRVINDEDATSTSDLLVPSAAEEPVMLY